MLTRKTFTPNYLTHKAKKNKGDRPQSLYRNHHEAIVSREDFIAVQHLLDNAKYGNKSFLPELRVVDQGLLRGFVVLHPRWAGFRPEDYLQASAAAHTGEEEKGAVPSTWDGFERTRSQLFSDAQQASMVFQRNKVRLSTLCVRDLGEHNQVELLVDPLRKLLALRTASPSSRNALTCSTLSNGVYYPREMGAAAYFSTLFTLLGWNPELKYRVSGIRYRGEGETAYAWELLSDSLEQPEKRLPIEMEKLVDFMKERGSYRGGNSEFTASFNAFAGTNFTAKALKQQMNRYRFLLEDMGVRFENRRSNGQRLLNISFTSPVSDASDAENSGPVATLPASTCVPVRSP